KKVRRVRAPDGAALDPTGNVRAGLESAPGPGAVPGLIDPPPGKPELSAASRRGQTCRETQQSPRSGTRPHLVGCAGLPNCSRCAGIWPGERRPEKAKPL